MYPRDYLYSREHEWLRVEDDLCVLGITEFAQQELGEVVFVELPEVGQVFDTNDELGTIESVKAVAEVFTPVAGEVVEVNEAVVDDPELLNEDPHGEGWLIKIRFSSADDLKIHDEGRGVRGVRQEWRSLRTRPGRPAPSPSGTRHAAGPAAPSSTPRTPSSAAISGSNEDEVRQMLEAVGAGSLAELVRETVPESILRDAPLDLAGLPADRELGEQELLAALRGDRRRRTGSSAPSSAWATTAASRRGVIQRNILENPGWYTPVHPLPVGDLAGAPGGAAQLPDDGGRPDRAAGRQRLACSTRGPPRPRRCTSATTLGRRQAERFFVAEDCHPQTIAVVQTRAEAIGVEVRVGDPAAVDFSAGDLFGVLLQYPATDGRVVDYAPFAEQAHAAGALVVVAADLLALTLLRPPGEFGADIAVGSAQRFGVPHGLRRPARGLPRHPRRVQAPAPGRIIGVSRDRRGKTALRMAMQTREQHIRREKATSNICTAQVLLAIMASMYAVYHGPEGLKAIARRVHALAAALAEGLRHLGYAVGRDPFFDTLRVGTGERAADELVAAAEARGINLRKLGERLGRHRSRRGCHRRRRRGDAGRLRGRPKAAGLSAERLAEGADFGFPAPHARRRPS